MKIKLINYPYQNFQIGDICDLGDEKNRSMVSLDRAVFVTDHTTSTFQEEIREVIKDVTTPLPKPKKLLNNDLRDQVQAVKKRASWNG